MATRELRINRQIRAHQVLVIDENGVQRGVMSVPEACRLAEEAGMDLVEVSPNANPPVCKILDFGRYRYEMEKKSREAKKNQTVVKIKEIRMQPKIEKHDLETKSKAIAEFLQQGNKVKVSIRFRGRELAHPELGKVVLDKILDVNLMPLTDSLTEENLVKLTEAKASRLMTGAGKVEDNMRHVLRLLSEDGYTAPPMHLPLSNFSLPMTGASVGRKMNPFYKVTGEHDGLDFMAPLGDEVLAAADGTVSQVTRSRRGEGNVVVMEHSGGYSTKYAHLQDITVRKGQQVTRGTVIGHVGMSGLSFAPHLHYEVWKDTVLCDPVNFLFGSVDPGEYAHMFIVSVATGQSLD